MISIGKVRATEQLGGEVALKEIRKGLKLEEGDELEIFIDGDNIILKKYTPGCHCCKNVDELTEVLDLKLCSNCIIQFNNARNIIDKLR